MKLPDDPPPPPGLGDIRPATRPLSAEPSVGAEPTATPAPPEPPIIGDTREEGSQVVSLERLFELAGPLVTEYFDHVERKEIRELDFEAKVLREDVAWRKMLLAAGAVLGIAVFVAAALLFSAGKDGTAMTLIQMVVGLAGAAFGGYGIARARARAEEEE